VVLTVDRKGKRRGNKKKRSYQEGNRSAKQRKKLKLTAYAFSFVIGISGPHSRQEREEKRKQSQIHPVPLVSCGSA
jgi:hypothetical protein